MISLHTISTLHVDIHQPFRGEPVTAVDLLISETLSADPVVVSLHFSSEEALITALKALGAAGDALSQGDIDSEAVKWDIKL